MDLLSIGNFIAQLRKQKELTQEQLAAAAALHPRQKRSAVAVALRPRQRILAAAVRTPSRFWVPAARTATICMKHPRLRYRIWVLQSKSSM